MKDLMSFAVAYEGQVEEEAYAPLKAKATKDETT